MAKYTVYQKFASVSHYRHNKKLEYNLRLYGIGIFEADDIVKAIRLASKQSTVPQICLSAREIKE